MVKAIIECTSVHHLRRLIREAAEAKESLSSIMAQGDPRNRMEESSRLINKICAGLEAIQEMKKR